ncbi:hypothetical protein ILUMI_01802 [Ignelater luminosus]|uniref:HAT C-terminal dimerisation domain-containing protein n=1 Tax=Ignelater luminosus TaxID=2038154 RepID=A0A8K0GLX1_IGNLU|nr:hypothetical protein ILUMI_01802 [Ignelater luminosus]
MKFLNKPKEILDSARASTSTDPEPMEVFEEKKICCSPSPHGNSSDPREGTTEELKSDTSSSAVCSSLACGDDPGLWPVSINSGLVNITTVNQMQLNQKKKIGDVIERIIAVIKYLSRQCLAFRDSSKTLFEHDNGNFLKAIEMIASFDSVMREHVHTIESLKPDSSRRAHYLGDGIQDEIIDLLSMTIKNYILNKVRELKYFSIIRLHTEYLKLKAVSATRWSSRIDAIKPLRYYIDKIFDALLEISENSSEWNCFTTHEAHSLALNLVLQEATKVAHELNSTADFPPINTLRPRRRPKQFEYEQHDEVLLDFKINYRVFFRILNQTLTSLKNRFEELKTFHDAFGFFGSKLFSYSKDELMKHSKDLYLKLKDDSRSETNIDGNDLYNEINALKLHFLKNQSSDPHTLLQYLFTNNLISTFPNTAIALRILLTLSVSVASGERYFLKLKIIKNYLRSTMH